MTYAVVFAISFSPKCLAILLNPVIVVDPSRRDGSEDGSREKS